MSSTCSSIEYLSYATFVHLLFKRQMTIKTTSPFLCWIKLRDQTEDPTFTDYLPPLSGTTGWRGSSSSSSSFSYSLPSPSDTGWRGAPRAWAPILLLGAVNLYHSHQLCMQRPFNTQPFTMHFQKTPARASSLKQHNLMNNRNYSDVTLSLGGRSTLLLPPLLSDI